jgi:8-oxo-dGTP diphosphatase
MKINKNIKTNSTIKINKYVLCFLFNKELTNVALIIKTKPEWQKGCLNGIGGKIEDGETPFKAICRELYEECGAKIAKGSLINFCIMSGTNNDNEKFIVNCFTGYYKLSQLKTKTEEEIVIYGVDRAISLKNEPLKRIDNVPWLVLLAIYFLKGGRPPKRVIVKY